MLQIEEATKRVVEEVNEESGGGERSDHVGGKRTGGVRGEVVRFSEWAEAVRGSREFLDHIHRECSVFLVSFFSG